MSKLFKNCIFIATALWGFPSFAEGPRCTSIFAANERLATFELETQALSSDVPRKKSESLEKSISGLLQKIPASSVSVSKLMNGHFVFSAIGLSVAELQKAILDLNQTQELEKYLSSFFKYSRKKEIRFGNAENSLADGQRVFEGKHAFVPFESALQKLRSDWDRRFPLKDYQVVGLEGPFGTRIEDAERLVGLNLVGIGVTIKRIISKPLDSASIEDFNGKVISITNTNLDGADPIWNAVVETAFGAVRVNLTEARGLRVLKEPGIKSMELSGNEIEASKVRRADSIRKFAELNRTLSPKSSQKNERELLMGRLSRMPKNEQVVLLEARAIVNAAFEKSQLLKRTSFDKALRPLAKLKDESFRPMVEEVQRQLYDTDGVFGFKEWLKDFALEVYLDVYQTRGLKFGDRHATLRDAHANYPFAEGLHGLPLEKVTVSKIPLVTENDVVGVIDRRIQRYGYVDGIGKVSGVRLADGAKYLATLKGLSLEDTTVLFVEYSKKNLLFQDTYFIGKPHGQYSHVFQWLYLAERMSQPEQNIFDANMLKPLMKMQPYFMDDFATGVRVTDFVGQRAPQNPDYINNLLQLIFPLN